MADDAIRQGHRNVMKQRFLNFVHGHPSDLVSVSELWLRHNDVTGEWEPVFADLARDVAKREELGLGNGEEMRYEMKLKDRVEEGQRKATANRLEELFDKSVKGDLTGKPIEVGKLTEEGREFLEKLSGIKFKGEVSFVINPSDMVHIYRRHFGKNEKDGRNIPLTKEDIRNIHEILCNPDNVIYGVERTGQKRAMFFFLKEVGNGSYNLMEVYADRKGNLTSKSFFKSKEGVSQRAMLLNESSTLTSVTDGATLSDSAKLPQFFEYPKLESIELYFREGETGDIWKDGSIGMEERMTNAAVRLANNQSGIPPHVVMKWTGHSDISAMKPYIDIAEVILNTEMDKFNR